MSAKRKTKEEAMVRETKEDGKVAHEKKRPGKGNVCEREQKATEKIILVSEM